MIQQKQIDSIRSAFVTSDGEGVFPFRHGSPSSREAAHREATFADSEGDRLADAGRQFEANQLVLRSEAGRLREAEADSQERETFFINWKKHKEKQL